MPKYRLTMEIAAPTVHLAKTTCTIDHIVKASLIRGPNLRNKGPWRVYYKGLQTLYTRYSIKAINNAIKIDAARLGRIQKIIHMLKYRSTKCQPYI